MERMRWSVRLSGLVAFACLLPPAGGADEAGFRPIFDGATLQGWDGDPRFWSVRDGAITGRTTPENPAAKNTFLVWRLGEVDDFELRLQYRIIGGNSGIQFRSRERSKGEVEGYQADLESGPRWTGALYDERGRGVLAARGQRTSIDEEGLKRTEQAADPAALLAGIEKEGWNDYAIVARGPRMILKIDGRVTAEVTDRDRRQSERSGILALQVHAGPPMTVQFRRIRLKRLAMQDRRKVVFVAGRPSHGRGAHEHNAGVLLLRRCLDAFPDILGAVYLNGWPKDPTAFDNADAIVIFSDGGGGHPMLRHDALGAIGRKMAEGVGLAMIHYAIDVPKNRGARELLAWIGGYYEAGYSTNPTWTASFEKIPEHPITRGIEPFALRDEWYFHIRFRPGMEGVTPLLTAVPPDAARRTRAAREHAGRAEVVAWCTERPDGGRGFAITGGHWHRNWGNDAFRTIVLNAICWIAHVEVPAGGVPSRLEPGFLEKNLD